MTFIIILLAIILAILLGAVYIIHEIKSGLGSSENLIRQISEATEEAARTPLTISGAEGMYSARIKKDFPEFNFDIASQTVTNVLAKYFNVLNTDISDQELLFSCTKSFVGELEARKQMEDIFYDKFHIHKVAISDYRKTNEEAVITYQAAVEYQLSGKMMSQHVYTIKYVYFLEYGADGENVSLRCQHCGAPIDNVGLKVCPYCDCAIEASVERTWKVNKIEKLR